MKILEPTIDSIFKITNSQEFELKAIEVFRFQSKYNAVYKEFISILGVNPETVTSLEEIPFLPISFFKSHKVVVNHSYQRIFKSSGTTNQERSKHFIYSIKLYEKSFINSFNQFFGNFKETIFLALLPSYMEQGDSSLIYMVNYFIENTNQKGSAFYLNNQEELTNKIKQLEAEGKKYVLLGVSYALLDFMDKFPQKLVHGKLMETGGMKGRRKEMTKEELHKELKKGFGTESVFSEYGMTELLSQAYSLGSEIFQCPPWMQVRIRNTTDPFEKMSAHARGLINVIDLANLYSCSFIATDDVGFVEGNGYFQVLGRFDSADIRGCNLMIQ